jgi:aldose sugar dehydrogenase
MTQSCSPAVAADTPADRKRSILLKLAAISVAFAGCDSAASPTETTAEARGQAQLETLAPKSSPPPPVSTPPSSAAVQCISTGSSSVRTEIFASGLSSPWGMAFLPDRRVLVTQKSGSMVLVSSNGATRTRVNWVGPSPQVLDVGQGGLLDVALDPDFSTSPWVYFTYAEPGPNNTSGTAVGRARLQGTELVNFQRLYQQTPKLDYSDVHFGSRLAFRSDGTLFVSFGDRGYEDPARNTNNFAQSAANSIGKIIRINPDGTIPAGNPFQGQSGALPEVWSVGHRNPQGLAYDATTGALWSSEHGAQGGDEVNLVLPGANYGWPLRSYGCPYGAPQGTACRAGGGTHLPLRGTTFREPLTYWAPMSMAPSNMIVYRGQGFPEWNGQLFVAGLQARLWRIELNNGVYVSCESFPVNQRVRDVRQGPDGWIWLLTDAGEIRRLVR